MERDEKGRFIKGHKQSNTGKSHFKKGVKVRLGEKHTEESKKKMSKSKKGIDNSYILREYHKKHGYKRGEKHHCWKGGVDESSNWRGRIEWKLWREAVFLRDDFTCQKCLEKGGRLHPHHIKTFKENIDCRFAIDNGITFCEKCHRLFHKTYGRIKIGKKQIDEFIKNNKES